MKNINKKCVLILERIAITLLTIGSIISIFVQIYLGLVLLTIAATILILLMIYNIWN